MLITEEVEIEGEWFVHNYSDAKFYIRKIETGDTYEEAYDPIEFRELRHYEETDEKIVDPEPSLMNSVEEDELTDNS